MAPTRDNPHQSAQALTGTPGACPFGFGAQPQDFALVSAAEPVPVDITAELELTGGCEVTANDPTGLYCRLRGARRTSSASW